MKKLFLFFLMLPAALFAQTETAEPVKAARQNSFWQTLIMIGIAILFFYFILWRPEQRRRKEMERKRGALKKGDTVTAMGIVGTVDTIKENTLILRMVDGSKIEVIKGAISEVKSSEEPSDKEKETK